MTTRDELPEWLLQVRETLTALGMLDDGLRDEVVRQVRDAVEAADDDVHRQDLTTPSIRVLRGGRQDPVTGDTDVSEEVGAADDEATVVRGALGDLTSPRLQLVEGQDEQGRRVHVQVLRPDMLGGTPPSPASLDDGHLRVSGGEDVWQTFVSGESPASYRVHCDRGEMLVASDQEVRVRLEAGQSVDLTGILLRVRATGASGATGRYRRLAGEP